MIRTVLLCAIMATWLIFVYTGKKDRMQYLSVNLPTTQPGELAGWKSNKLFFLGWSPAEPTHRGSNSRHPGVCFKPEADAAAGSGSFVIEFDATAIAPLAGKTIRIRINDRSYDYLLAAAPIHILKYPNFPRSTPALICLNFDLPLGFGDIWKFRGLGLMFKGLRYTYETSQHDAAQ